jgi:hypothetical protein
METKITMEELVEFLNRQADEFATEQQDIDLDGQNFGNGLDYSYALGAEEAYRFVLRTMEEWS